MCHTNDRMRLIIINSKQNTFETKPHLLGQILNKTNNLWFTVRQTLAKHHVSVKVLFPFCSFNEYLTDNLDVYLFLVCNPPYSLKGLIWFFMLL